MKRILSILLTAAMLCTMVCVPAMATVEATVVKNFFSTDTGVTNLNNNTITTSQVTQIMGRGSDDKSTYVTRVRVEANNGNHKVQHIISPGTGDELYGDLLVFGLSFCVQKNIGNIFLSGNGGVGISKTLKINSSNNFTEGWNKVVYVYDHSTASSTMGSGNYAGSWAMYVNGKCINKLGENRVEVAAATPFDYIAKGKLQQMRIILACDDATDIGVYLDDAYAYSVSTSDKSGFMAQFEEEAPAVLAASNAEYTVSGTTITPASGAKLSSLNVTEGATLTAFTSDEFSYQLASTDALEDGNKVVVNKNGIFTYYTVLESGSTDNLIYSTRFSGGAYASGLTLANSGYFSAEFVTGKAGKQSADTSLNFKRDAAPGEASDWMGNNIYTYLFAPIDKAYIKYEFNFMPGDENFLNCGFKTQGHGNISSNIACTDSGTSVNHCLNRYQWNKIVYIFKNNSTTVDTTAKKLSGTYDMYVNGVQIANDVAVAPAKTNNNANATNTPLRFAIYGKDVSNNGAIDYSAISCYIDDIDVRWYDSEPELRTMPYAIDDGGETVSVTGSTYTIYDDVKVNDIKYSEGANLTVFDVPTYDYYLIGTNALYDNNLIVVWDKYNQYTYYTVKKEIRNNATITPYVGYYVAKANLKDAILLVAGYDEAGDMKAVNFTDEQGPQEVRIDGNYDTVKAFIWNGTNSVKPITDVNTYISRPVIACWGASITYGQGATNRDTDTFPAALGIFTGFDSYNLGIGGETQTTIASRQGGLDVKLTKDITIPESGSVAIEFAAYDKDGTYAGVVTPRNAALAGWNPVTINGIEGTLGVVVNNDVWPRVLKSATFTRKTAGEAVNVSAGTQMFLEAHKYNAMADIMVIAVSSNGGWSPENTTASDGQSAELITLLDKMIANCKNPDKFVIVGLTTGTSSSWTQTHAALASYYGDHFLNIKDYLVSEQALIDAGLTPTDTDKEWIAAGHIPPQLINNPAPTIAGGTGYDNVHLNSAGYTRMGYGVYQKFIELGYCVAE